MPHFPFIKMHGAENDYVFFDGFTGALPQDPVSLAREICSRHAHIGADGIIYMIPPPDDLSDVEMRIWNADGSSAQMCGNGARCVAVWMQREGRVRDVCRIFVSNRVITAVNITHGTRSGSAVVEMGSPELLTSGGGRMIELDHVTKFVVHSVHIGNPHAVVFVDELSDQLIRNIGPQIEHHPEMSERTNVEFAAFRGDQELDVRVWERGSGETRSCGSGACAVVAAATLADLVTRNLPCRVILPGGSLDVLWRPDGQIQLSGPVAITFTGILSG
ncbi:MAG: diaminopimelate epimerase [Fuerstiella sp.]|nr:diaminopimelate epimerase [Fuerstiella sp.]